MAARAGQIRSDDYYIVELKKVEILTRILVTRQQKRHPRLGDDKKEKVLNSPFSNVMTATFQKTRGVVTDFSFYLTQNPTSASSKIRALSASLTIALTMCRPGFSCQRYLKLEPSPR
jgi:hypothetical protein